MCKIKKNRISSYMHTNELISRIQSKIEHTFCLSFNFKLCNYRWIVIVICALQQMISIMSCKRRLRSGWSGILWHFKLSSGHMLLFPPNAYTNTKQSRNSFNDPDSPNAFSPPDTSKEFQILVHRRYTI